MAEEDKSFLAWVPPSVYDDAHFCKKYAIERELGMGASGVVVCALHRELDERVAIKFLLSEREDEAALARFRREARAANRVKNDHVVRIIDAATTDAGVPYVVMEYLEGVDLERMLLEVRDRQLPVRDAVEFVLQACEGLAECHANRIVHRDLKPSNLFCTHGADGLPLIKVLDFGISKLVNTTLDGGMTGRHAIIGSPHYMSPEQFDAPADVDVRSDIWSLGIILYEFVTGKPPFNGNTLISIWEKVKRNEPQAISELRPDVPLGLPAVILRCLEKDPANRYQDVAQLAKALLPLAPERSRSSVARIVRIVESPGVTTESLLLPRSGNTPPRGTLTSELVGGRPVSGGATALSVRPERKASRALVTAGVIMGVVGGVVAFSRQIGPKPPAASGPAGPTPTNAATTLATPSTASLLGPPPVVMPERASAAAPTLAHSALSATTAAGAGGGPPRSPDNGAASARGKLAAASGASPIHTPAATSSERPPGANPSANPLGAPSDATPSTSAATVSRGTASVAPAPTPVPFIVDVVEKRKQP